MNAKGFGPESDSADNGKSHVPVLLAAGLAFALLAALLMWLAGDNGPARAQSPPPIPEPINAPLNNDDKVFTALSLTEQNSCGVTADFNIRCWSGYGGPIWAPGYTFVAVGKHFSCGLKEDPDNAGQTNGAIFCWGSGAPPKLPTGKTFEFLDIPRSTIACGLLDGNTTGQTAGTPYCWQNDSNSNHEEYVLPDDIKDLALSRLDGVVVNLSGTQTWVGCGLLRSGSDIDEPRCANVPNFTQTLQDTPMADLSVSDWVDLSACGVVKSGHTDAGKIKCWGGSGTAIGDKAPTGSDFTAITLGYDHACALKTDKTAHCWGPDTSSDNRHDHDYGQYDPPSGATFSALTTDRFHTCGILDKDQTIDSIAMKSGAIHCWGADTAHFWSWPKYSNFQNDAMVVPLEDREDIPALKTTPGSIDGHQFTTCAHAASGEVRCWGNTVYAIFDHQADDLGSVLDFSAGQSYSCVIKADGKARCFGDDRNYRSTAGTGRGGNEQVDLSARTFSQISAGAHHTCAVQDNATGQTAGEVKCWGSGSYGRTTPPANTTFSLVDTGPYHSCGLKDGQNSQTEGETACWGYNYQGVTAIPTKTPSGGVCFFPTGIQLVSQLRH